MDYDTAPRRFAWQEKATKDRCCLLSEPEFELCRRIEAGGVHLPKEDGMLHAVYDRFKDNLFSMAILQTEYKELLPHAFDSVMIFDENHKFVTLLGEKIEFYVDPDESNNLSLPPGNVFKFTVPMVMFEEFSKKGNGNVLGYDSSFAIISENASHDGSNISLETVNDLYGRYTIQGIMARPSKWVFLGLTRVDHDMFCVVSSNLAYSFSTVPSKPTNTQQILSNVVSMSYTFPTSHREKCSDILCCHGFLFAILSVSEFIFNNTNLGTFVAFTELQYIWDTLPQLKCFIHFGKYWPYINKSWNFPAVFGKLNSLSNGYKLKMTKWMVSTAGVYVRLEDINPNLILKNGVSTTVYAFIRECTKKAPVATNLHVTVKLYKSTLNYKYWMIFSQKAVPPPEESINVEVEDIEFVVLGKRKRNPSKSDRDAKKSKTDGFTVDVISELFQNLWF